MFKIKIINKLETGIDYMGRYFIYTEEIEPVIYKIIKTYTNGNFDCICIHRGEIAHCQNLQIKFFYGRNNVYKFISEYSEGIPITLKQY